MSGHRVLIALVVVVLAARLVGLVFRRMGQPQVVGEMTAGILLGPSLLGWVAPGLSAWLFSPASLSFLGALSQIGLLLFMFLVGLHLDLRLLRAHGRAAVAISQAGIIVPFALAFFLALYLYPRLSVGSVSFAGFAMFMGVSMSVTAFPVLARILAERDMVRTEVGAIALACAAADDVSAWCLLAASVALVRDGTDGLPLWAMLGGSILFTAVMILGVRPLLARLEGRFLWEERLTPNVLGTVLLVALGSAWITEVLGIHAIFGAFLAGAVMPRGGGFGRAVAGKFEDVVVVLLMPGFFALTGLRTRVGLVQGVEGWLLCGLIILVAVVGKFGGAALVARWSGMGWRQSGAIGVLMNNRGLMELVILNVGLEIGVIPPTLFTMMVIMALVTTFATTPLLAWLYPMGSFGSDRSALAGTASAKQVATQAASS